MTLRRGNQPATMNIPATPDGPAPPGPRRLGRASARALIRSVSPVFTALFVLLAAGCETSPDASRIGRYVVTAKKAPFYKYGPAQSSGPDSTLPKGQALSVFRQQMGFAQVVLDDGVSGYVASGDLAPAPDAPRELPETRAESRGRKPRWNVPEPDLPEPGPIPGGSIEPRGIEEPLGLPVLPDPDLFAPAGPEGTGQPGDLPASDGEKKPVFRY